jgi:hypothetical protein
LKDPQMERVKHIRAATARKRAQLFEAYREDKARNEDVRIPDRVSLNNHLEDYNLAHKFLKAYVAASPIYESSEGVVMIEGQRFQASDIDFIAEVMKEQDTAIANIQIGITEIADQFMSAYVQLTNAIRDQNLEGKEAKLKVAEFDGRVSEIMRYLEKVAADVQNCNEVHHSISIVKELINSCQKSKNLDDHRPKTTYERWVKPILVALGTLLEYVGSKLFPKKSPQEIADGKRAKLCKDYETAKRKAGQGHEAKNIREYLRDFGRTQRFMEEVTRIAEDGAPVQNSDRAFHSFVLRVLDDQMAARDQVIHHLDELSDLLLALRLAFDGGGTIPVDIHNFNLACSMVAYLYQFAHEEGADQNFRNALAGLMKNYNEMLKAHSLWKEDKPEAAAM